jgi:outer membrane protein OmpA-like peptidoglycan-associated protein/tetratricopeptide (TPR) repeat protein
MINRFTIILAILGIFIFRPVSAQLEVNVRSSEFKVAKTGFSEAWKHIKEGDRLARKGRGGLPFALNEYLAAYTYNSENAELNYKVGICLLSTDKKRDAITYLSKAYFQNPQIIPGIHFLLARAYHYNLEFDNATKEYELYYQSLRRKEKKHEGPDILKFKEECSNAKELVSSPKRVIIRNLGDSVNSIYDDYNPVFGPRDSIMYFISRRPATAKSKQNILDYRFNEDIYTSLADSGNWKNTRRLPAKFNDKHHNGVVWVSSDGNTLFLYNGYKDNGDLEYSVLKKGKWSKPSKLRGGFSTDEKESSLSITADGNEVYFVSNDRRESFGRKDIFYSVKNKRGKWTSPKNAGSSINTLYDEEGVYVSPDGKTLYFSSKGHNSMGGFDIFKVVKDDKNEWSKAENIGYPVNTPDDELFYRPCANGKQGYYSGIRPDSKGGKDIYKVTFLGAEKEMILLSEDQLISYRNKPFQDVFARIPQEVSIDTSITLKGIITDVKTNNPIIAKINLIDLEKSQVVATTISDTTGGYQIPLPLVKNYGIEINARDYMFLLDVVNMPASVSGRELLRNFSMTKVEVGAKVILKNIYFETGKATLKSESFPELDKVLKFLEENNDLKIEISGHTDNVGSLKSNTNLSEARAKAVVEYFSSHGIAKERLVYRGYAFSQPIAPNNTPDGRKMNRRVEFKILGKE